MDIQCAPCHCIGVSVSTVSESPKLNFLGNKIWSAIVLLISLAMFGLIVAFGNSKFSKFSNSDFLGLAIFIHVSNATVFLMIAFMILTPAIGRKYPDQWNILIPMMTIISYLLGIVVLMETGIQGPKQNVLAFMTCIQFLILVSFAGILLIFLFVRDFCMCERIN